MKISITSLCLVIALLFVVGQCFALSALPYLDYNNPTTQVCYSGTTGIDAGYSIYSVNNSGSGMWNSLLLYNINVWNLGASLDTAIFYDAATYTDATLNRRPILAEVVYATGSTYLLRGKPVPGINYVAPVELTTGYVQIGDVGACIDFTNNGKPLRLRRGLTMYLGNPGTTGWNGAGSPKAQNYSISFDVWANFQ